ncbi:hypothetical protein [uncultured Parasutterella sp.]|uniref:hypothetical protein n=1 Tax=uncultured Parasutterella sp. TaxID=1263098 RepID=UPI0025B6FD2E|nr:hypothetical protein [uncultured Parasutterella sp.]
MSLETVISENTRAVNALAELIKQAMGMLPPTGTAPVTPTAPQPAPKTASAPAPVAEPAAPAAPAAPTASVAPAAPVDFAELRRSLMPRVQKLFTQSREIGMRVLASVGAKNVSGVPDDKLEAFSKAVDEALAKAIGEALSRA